MATARKLHEPTVSDLSDQVATLKSDIADLTKMMGEMGQAKLSAAREAAEVQAKQAYGTAEEYAFAAGESVDQALDVVRKQPGNAMAIAVGAGFLAGLLWGRK